MDMLRHLESFTSGYYYPAYLDHCGAQGFAPVSIIEYIHLVDAYRKGLEPPAPVASISSEKRPCGSCGGGEVR